MDTASIANILQRQREHFDTGTTRDVRYGVEQLRNLKNAIDDNEEEIRDALKLDLNKPLFEAYLGEIAVLIKEIDCTIRYLPSWTRPQRVCTPLLHFPAASYICSEPLGVTLLIGTWNCPVQLILPPLVGALAAGNCAILKPSRLAPNTSQLIAAIIQQSFDPELAAVIQGDTDYRSSRG